MASNDQTRYTGDRPAWTEAEREYQLRMAADGEGHTASLDAQLIAAAIRAGLAELAVDVASIRAFGVGQAKKS